MERLGQITLAGLLPATLTYSVRAASSTRSPGRGQVAVAMVHGEAQPVVEREARGCCRRAPGGTPSSRRARRPSSRSAAITTSPSRRPRSAGSTSMVRKPTQSSAYAATPLPPPGRRRCGPAVTRWSSPTIATSTSRSATPAGSGAPPPPRRARRRCRGRGSPGPSRARGTARPRPSPGARPRSAAGPALVEGHDAVVVVGHAGRTHRQHRVGAAGGRGRGAAQQPVAERLGLEVRPQRQCAALRLLRRDPVPGRRAGRDRLARDDVGDGDGDRVGRPLAVGLDDADAVAPRHVQVPSTSVSAGPPLGPVSPGTTRRTTTLWPTTCGPSMWDATPGY